jgi:hypothetical protein
VQLRVGVGWLRRWGGLGGVWIELGGQRGRERGGAFGRKREDSKGETERCERVDDLTLAPRTLRVTMVQPESGRVPRATSAV